MVCPLPRRAGLSRGAPLALSVQAAAADYLLMGRSHVNGTNSLWTAALVPHHLPPLALAIACGHGQCLGCQERETGANTDKPEHVAS